MADTNVPLATFNPTGLLVPTEPEILAGVRADWQAAFAAAGKALNTELTTPQGQLMQAQTYQIAAFNALLLQLIGNVDPLTTSGAFQDALGRIYFLTRQAATYATVQATVAGTVGTTLPQGAQVRSSDGALWESTADVSFGPTGTASATFRALSAGNTAAAGVNDLTIYQQVQGWESVRNTTPSVPGVDAESRQSFEERRAASVNIGGSGTAQAVRAAIANVPGVSDAYIYNNGGDAAINYGATNYPIPAHSLAIMVVGGDDSAVALAINSKLDCGCGMPTAAGLGTLTTVILEDSVNYVPPYPKYEVRFVRPKPVPVYVSVDVANLSSLPATYVSDVQRAVAAAITDGYTTPDGTITVERARVGSQIVVAEYFTAILALGNVTPVAMRIAFKSNPTDPGARAVTLGIDQVPTIAPGNIVVNSVSV